MIAGSLFAYANNMDRRVAILEEKMQVQAAENQRSQTEVKELASDVKHELRLLRTELFAPDGNKTHHSTMNCLTRSLDLLHEKGGWFVARASAHSEWGMHAIHIDRDGRVTSYVPPEPLLHTFAFAVWV